MSNKFGNVVANVDEAVRAKAIADKAEDETKAATAAKAKDDAFLERMYQELQKVPAAMALLDYHGIEESDDFRELSEDDAIAIALTIEKPIWRKKFAKALGLTLPATPSENPSGARAKQSGVPEASSDRNSETAQARPPVAKNEGVSPTEGTPMQVDASEQVAAVTNGVAVAAAEHKDPQPTGDDQVQQDSKLRATEGLTGENTETTGAAAEATQLTNEATPMQLDDDDDKVQQDGKLKATAGLGEEEVDDDDDKVDDNDDKVEQDDRSEPEDDEVEQFEDLNDDSEDAGELVACEPQPDANWQKVEWTKKPDNDQRVYFVPGTESDPFRVLDKEANEFVAHSIESMRTAFSKATLMRAACVKHAKLQKVALDQLVLENVSPTTSTSHETNLPLVSPVETEKQLASPDAKERQLDDMFAQMTNRQIMCPPMDTLVEAAFPVGRQADGLAATDSVSADLQKGFQSAKETMRDTKRRSYPKFQRGVFDVLDQSIDALRNAVQLNHKDTIRALAEVALSVLEVERQLHSSRVYSEYTKVAASIVSAAVRHPDVKNSKASGKSNMKESKGKSTKVKPGENPNAGDKPSQRLSLYNFFLREFKARYSSPPGTPASERMKPVGVAWKDRENYLAVHVAAEQAYAAYLEQNATGSQPAAAVGTKRAAVSQLAAAGATKQAAVGQTAPVFGQPAAAVGQRQPQMTPEQVQQIMLMWQAQQPQPAAAVGRQQPQMTPEQVQQIMLMWQAQQPQQPQQAQPGQPGFMLQLQ